MSEIFLRDMKSEEAPLILKGQRSSFSPLFALFLSRPRQAVVAELDGKIVGAVTYKIIGDHSVGYLDVAYVDASQRGYGLGTRLYEETMRRLKEAGCHVVAATIRDDNRRSWKIMEKNGCVPVSFAYLVRTFGFTDALRIYFSTHMAYALGHDLWMSTSKPYAQLPAVVLSSFLINYLLLFVASRGNFAFALGALFVLAGEFGFGWLGTLETKARWEVRRPHDGLPLYLAIALTGGLLPLVVSWHPVEDTFDTSQYYHLLARSSLAGWVWVLATAVFSFSLVAGGSFVRGMQHLVVMLLIYRVLAFFPFESYGGKRVYDSSLWLYGLMVALSLPLIVYFFLA